MNTIQKREKNGGQEQQEISLPKDHADAWSNLRRAANELSAHIERDLKANANGISLNEFDILRLLAADTTGSVGLRRISYELHQSRSATTRLIDRMASETGFVKKQGNECDRRAVQVEITPAGRMAMKEQLRPVYEKAVRAHFANVLTHSEALTIIVLSEKLLRRSQTRGDHSRN